MVPNRDHAGDVPFDGCRNESRDRVARAFKRLRMSVDDTSGVARIDEKNGRARIRRSWLLPAGYRLLLPAIGCCGEPETRHATETAGSGAVTPTGNRGRETTTKFARSRTSGYRCHVSISANASAPVMKKICDAARPVALANRVSVSAVYDGPGADSSMSLARGLRSR